MRTSLFLLIVPITLTVLDGCSKKEEAPAPVAGFLYSGANDFSPAVVLFTNSSTNATSYSWDFGDNGTSTSQNPNHTYASGGVYTVKLTATGDGGSNSVTKTVNISDSPETCIIKNVSIIDCPLTTGGAGWDAISAPDFYISCSPGIDESANYYLDNVSFPLTWTENWSISSSNFSTTYSMKVYEHDYPDADDFVSTLNFTLSDYTTVSNHYPSEFTLTNGETQIKISVIWE